jgi:hypothetical protein
MPGLIPAALGQSPLDRIEDQIRQQAGPGSPAAVPAPPGDRGLAAKAPSERGYLGAIVDDRTDRGRGTRVVEVRPGSPADRAGLRLRDLIVGAAGTRVRQTSDLEAILNLLGPGDKVILEVSQGVGLPRKLEVTLGQRGVRPELLPGPPADRTPGAPAERLPAPPTEPLAPAGPSLQPPVPPAPAGAPASDAARIEQLQRRVDQLERRVEELERALNEAKRKP